MNEKITSCIKDMLTYSRLDLPFYGEFNLFINYKELKTIDTIGVEVHKGNIWCYYNEDFINSLSKENLNFTILHETFHLLLHHNERTIGYNHTLANIAQDAIINSLLLSNISSEFVKPLMNKNNEIIVVLPDSNYTGKLIFEEYYLYLSEKYEKWQQSSKDDEFNNSYVNIPMKDGSIKKAKGMSLGHIFKTMNNNEGQYQDTHFDNISSTLKDTLIDTYINDIKSRGIISADQLSFINDLHKTKKDWLKKIKRVLELNILDTEKQKTITRPNRRNITGLKGNKKYGFKINCILDTSGSMNDTFKKVITYIYKNTVKINLIQIDSKIQKVTNLKNNNKALKEIELKGGGGTILQPAVDLISKKYNMHNTLILTDGLCDTLDFTYIKGFVLILTTDRLISYTGKSINKVFQMKI